MSPLAFVRDLRRYRFEDGPMPRHKRWIGEVEGRARKALYLMRKAGR